MLRKCLVDDRGQRKTARLVPAAIKADSNSNNCSLQPRFAEEHLWANNTSDFEAAGLQQHHTGSQLSTPAAPQVPDHIDIWWAEAFDALQDVFQKGLRSHFTVSGLWCCHVLIKIQIPCIDCVIRLVQPGPGVLIRPVIYDHFQEKSFCVIIWGNRAWVSVILLDLFCCTAEVVGGKQTATLKPPRGEIFSTKKLLRSSRFHWEVNQKKQRAPQTHKLRCEAAACGFQPSHCWILLILAI